MTLILVLVIAAAIDGLLLWADRMLNGLWDIVFNISSQIPAGWFGLFVHNLQNTFFDVAIALLVVKFLKKIFDIYVLWSDGDPDIEPVQLLVNFAKALITAICFKYLWGLFVNIGKDLLNKAMNSIAGASGSLYAQWSNANWTSMGIVPVVFALVFLVILAILYFRFLKRGFEVAFMVCGAPLACIGLMDNDHGFFKPYITQLARLIITTIFQIICVRLAVSLALNTNIFNGDITSLFWGIGALLMSLSVPAILQEFMIPAQHSGGVGAKLHTALMLQQLVRKVV